MKNYNKIFIILLLLGIIACIFVICNYSNKLNEYKNDNNLLIASQDSLRKSFNEKTNKWEYERLTFKAENEQLNEYLKENQEDLYKLKKEKKALVGIIADFEVKIDTTVINDTTIINEPDTTVRVANIRNEFYTANIKSYTDSTNLKLQVIARQELAMTDSGSLVIVNHNPYVDVIQMNSFFVTPPKQKTKNWKYYIGFGIGLTAGYILLK